MTLTGTPVFGTAFANTTDLGMVVAAQNATFSGAATGQRYAANTNSVINTGGGGPTFLPGSINGAVTNGGVYV